MAGGLKYVFVMIRKFILFVVFVTVNIAVRGQEGVKFEILTFEEALVKAKAENKNKRKEEEVAAGRTRRRRWLRE